MSLIERVKELCNQRKITIAELERRIDFSQGSISRWTKQSPSADRIKKVADFFDVSVDYLLGRTDDPTPPKNNTDNHTLQLGGLFRSVAKKEELTEKQQEELKEDLDWYLRERARLLKERNKKG